MKYVIVIVLVLLINWYMFRKRGHAFWDRQPVSRTDGSHEGVISNIVPNPIGIKHPDVVETVLPDDTSFHKTFARFLNNHYVKDYIFDQKYISWLLSHPGLQKSNITTIQRNRELIGTIMSKPYSIAINGNTVPTNYVDMLSVHTKHRNKKYAPVLISNMLTNSCDETYKTCIFKKEEKPLPFNYICKTKYYSKDIIRKVKTNLAYTLTPTSPDDLEYISKLYEKESVKYKCFPILDDAQVKYIFGTNSLTLKVNGVHKGVITYTLNHIENTSTTIAEITLMLCEDELYVEAMKHMNNYCHTHKIDILLCIDMAKNRKCIDVLRFTKGLDVYFQMYNYTLRTPLNPSDILFNFF